jgi:beta-galactosidase/beta-glucuronidase
VKIVGALICLVILCSPLFSSPRIDLNPDWQFHTDPSKTGEQQAWFRLAPAELEPVSLPHTWNIGKHNDFLGTAWYFKIFASSPTWRGQHVELHFGATFYKSRIWLNGKLVGEHEGGYSEYYLDISQYLKDSNFLAVEINNEPKVDTIPGADLKAAPDGTIYDWWPYGGIVRDAWLTVNETAVVRWQHINSRPSGTTAAISNRILLENVSSKEQAIKVRASVFAMDSDVPLTFVEKELNARPGTQTVDISLMLDKVKLWSFDNPFLYRSQIAVLAKDGHILDTLADNFGVRTIEIRDRHLYLNGERVRLSGVTRHEGSPWEGLAETRGTMLHDYDDLKNLQTTLTRPVHYQQHPFIYDYADRNGILMIPEIPMWQFSEAQLTNPKVIALAKQLLRDLIEQNYNHPSIFAWSMENESATNTPGGIAYFKTMYAYAKELDPGRYVSFADDVIASVEPSSNASSLADFVMWNEYFGSWDGAESLLPAAIEKIGKGYPDKMVVVTEFGYPGVFAADARTADKERVRIIRDHLALLSKQDWVAGALLWCYQDYHSFHNLRAGQADKYVDHGIVDKNRQRRPSYYVWQKENGPAHVQVKWNYDAKGVPIGFQATIARRSEQEIPSYPLVNYSVEWRVLDASKKRVAGEVHPLDPIGTARSVSGSWSPQGSNALRLELTLFRPTGFVAQREVLTWRAPQEGGLTEQDLEISDDQTQ